MKYLIRILLFSVLIASCSSGENIPDESNQKENSTAKKMSDWELISLSPYLSASMNLPEIYVLKENPFTYVCDDYRLVDINVQLERTTIHVRELENCIDDRLLIEYENIVADTAEFKIVQKTDRLIVKQNGEKWSVSCFRNPASWPYVFTCKGEGDPLKEKIIQSFQSIVFANEPEEENFHHH